ncbi:hypothetical protein [Candidatus Thiothrix anitrata]|uniref:Uncharacterized protein n=1 Tax=Candidatus Thiothrix anitrata TaxID=2823902 RepID=A0ABX7X7Q5_9GAMM|nr:hypothetical protein [Candidatus Thiothrix anitrata]QTR49620.1 hypothetical protein J8380_15495 [Candidatus Thiothrix anitrata]
MNNVKNVMPDDRGQADAFGEIIEFIVDLIKCEEGFEDFILSHRDHNELTAYFLKTYPISPESLTLPLQRKIVLDGLEYLKHLQTYRDFQLLRDQKLVIEAFEDRKIPREYLIAFAKPIDFHPKDCVALQDWPERRKLVDEGSARLENAGQFIQRLFDEKLYDEEKFGKLYLFDLRTINPKLYQALVQWQKRTGRKLLDNKKDEIDELLAKNKDVPLDFHDTSRLSSARWRRQQHKAAAV